MRIFVENLSTDTTNADLKTAFSRYGSVATAEVNIGRRTNRSRGSAYVVMEEQLSALNAIDGLRGSVLNGNTLAVFQNRR